MIASFRDPSGSLFVYDRRILRAINTDGEKDFKRALSSKTTKEYIAKRNLVNAQELPTAEIKSVASNISKDFSTNVGDVSLIVEHERIPFQNYPYEWAPEMLYSAALLTIEIHQKLLTEGMGLKDATPYNILFRGTDPVFVDWLSFEQREPLDSIWLPQAQFIRTFLLPLLANKNFGLDLKSFFFSHRDGLEPDNVFKMSKGIKKFLPPFLSLVTIPKLLSRKAAQNSAIYSKNSEASAEKAAFILNYQSNQLRNTLRKVQPESNQISGWSEYIGPKQHFTDAYLKHKEDFVTKTLAEYKTRDVLDIGCNTGHFSRIAALSGASVVSIDQDPVVMGKVWKAAKQEKLDILPLVVDFSRPSPGLGWLNNECPSFIDRAKGNFDAVLMLAVIHHLLVGERIPLSEIISLTADITKKLLIIEYVPPQDPMFKTIARGRDHLFEDLTEEKFQAACTKKFRIIKHEKLTQSDRTLYLLQK